MQKFGVFVLELNTPSANNNPTIMAITNIAHPYVIRYSMADWALPNALRFMPTDVTILQ